MALRSAESELSWLELEFRGEFRSSPFADALDAVRQGVTPCAF